MSNTDGPIILALTSYVEQGLTTILKASSDHAFDAAFDGFFSKELKDIMFNGKKLSREKYKEQMKSASNVNNTVSFEGIVSVLSSASTDAFQTGFVGVFMKASHPVTVVVDGAHAIRTLTSSLNIQVKEDSSLKLPVGADRRRVFTVDQVSMENNIGPKAEEV